MSGYNPVSVIVSGGGVHNGILYYVEGQINGNFFNGNVTAKDPTDAFYIAQDYHRKKYESEPLETKGIFTKIEQPKKEFNFIVSRLEYICPITISEEVTKEQVNA